MAGTNGKTVAAVNGESSGVRPELAEAMAKRPAAGAQATIAPLNMKVLELNIEGTAPLVQAKFSEKAKALIEETQAAGSTAKKGKARKAKDFEADYVGAMHLGPNGEHGIPASAFRAAAISACKIVGFHMTRAKLAIFIIPDFLSGDGEGTPLVRLNGTPRMTKMTVRNATGVVDIRARPMWDEWSATVRVRFDADQFTPVDVFNLFRRVGEQVGVGEGRPDSKSSAGMGWGNFRITGGQLVHIAEEEAVFSFG